MLGSNRTPCPTVSLGPPPGIKSDGQDDLGCVESPAISLVFRADAAQTGMPPAPRAASALLPAIESDTGQRIVDPATPNKSATRNIPEQEQTVRNQDDNRPSAALAMLLAGMAAGFPLALLTWLSGGGLAYMVLAFYLPPVVLLITLLIRSALRPEPAPHKAPCAYLARSRLRYQAGRDA